jgi:hypothetical protein
MTTTQQKVALVTGASSGIGKATALGQPLIFVRRWLPDRAYDAFIRRVSGIH